MVITQDHLTWIQISHLSHFQTKLSHPSVFLFNEYFGFFLLLCIRFTSSFTNKNLCINFRPKPEKVSKAHRKYLDPHL